MLQRIPQLSLLVKFSLLSLVAVGLMGGALAYVLKNQIRDRAAMDATRMATRIAHDWSTSTSPATTSATGSATST